MKLIILGSGTAIPRERRGASGYAILADDGTGLVLECGPGSTRRWPHAGLSFETVRAVFVSHHHVDHCADLPAVLFGRNVVRPSAETPLVLAGPVGHDRHLDKLRRLHGSQIDDRGTTTVVEMVDRDRYTIGPFQLRTRIMKHRRGSLGVRVTVDGRTLAFSGDSGPCRALIELCRDVDLALLECSHAAGWDTQNHLTTETAGQTAVEAGVRQLVLTHFYPDADRADRQAEVRATGYRGSLFLAEDLDRYDIGESVERIPGPWTGGADA